MAGRFLAHRSMLWWSGHADVEEKSLEISFSNM